MARTVGLSRRQGLGSKKSRVSKKTGPVEGLSWKRGWPRRGGARHLWQGGVRIGLPLVGGPYHLGGRGLAGRAGSKKQEG